MPITRGATVTQAVDSATPIITSFSHTVNSGTTLLIVSFHCEGDLGISSVAWNTTETMSLISSVTSSSSGGDCRVYVYGRVSPTAATANVTFTVTGAGDNLACVAANYLGTVASSVDDATNALDTEDNANAAAQTIALSGATALGSTLVCAATFYGDDGDPATVTGVTGFTDYTADTGGGSGTTDTSYYYGDKIGGGTGGTLSPTVDWTGTASDECVGVFIEILPADRAVSPGTGSCLFVEQQPTVMVPVSARPGTGTLRAIGNAPTIGTVTITDATVGTFALATTTYAPAISVLSAANPGSGSLRVSGNQPTVGATRSALPLAASLLIVGMTPLVGVKHSASPGSGALVFAGQQSTVSTDASKQASPTAGLIRMVGGQPTIGVSRSASPGGGAVAFSGQTPTVSSSANAFASPTVGSLRIGGQVPTVSSVGITEVAVGAFALATTAYAPTVNLSPGALPSSGAVLLVGQQPTVEAGANKASAPSSGLLRAAGQSPTVVSSVNQQTSPSSGLVRVIGEIPTAYAPADQVASPLVGTLRIEGLVPTLGGVLNTGDVFPTSGTSVAEAPWSDDAWVTPGNIVSDNGTTANIIASTYDLGDQSYVLYAKGFDFSSVPDTATITGISATINAWYRSGTGANSGDLAQLLSASGVRGGDNKWVGLQPLTTSNAALYTLGGANDLWGNVLSPTIVKSADFGIALGFRATANNSDVDVDYVALRVFYTLPPPEPEVEVQVGHFSFVTQAYVPAISVQINRVTSPGSGSVRTAGNLPSINAPPLGPETLVSVRERMLEVDQPFLTVVWTEPTTDIFGAATTITGYRVYAGTSPTVLTQYAEVAAPTTWAQIRLPAAGTWTVRVTAYNGDGESDQSLIETVVVAPNKFAPTISVSPGSSPGSGTLRTSGNPPTLQAGNSVAAPTTGTLLFVEQAPTLNAARSSAPSNGSLRLVGQPPARGVVAAAGSLRIVGNTPTVETNREVYPDDEGLVRFVGNQPTVERTSGRTAYPASGSVRLRGAAPLVYARVLAYPGSGALTILGKRPAVSRWSVTEGKWFSRLRLYAVLPNTGSWFERDAWASRDTGLYADHWSPREFATQVTPRLGEGGVTSRVGTTAGSGVRGRVDQGSTVDVRPVPVTLAGEGTLTYAGYGLRPATGTLRTVGNVSTVRVSTGPEVIAGAGSLRAVGNAPTVRVNVEARPAVGALRIVENAASLTNAHTGTGAMAVSAAIISRGEGTKNLLGDKWSGGGALAPALPEISGEGRHIPLLAITGTGDIAGLLPRTTGSGAQTLAPLAYVGNGALRGLRPTISARAKPRITGTGSLTSPRPTLTIKAWVKVGSTQKGWNKQSTGGDNWTPVITPEEEWNG